MSKVSNEAHLRAKLAVQQAQAGKADETQKKKEADTPDADKDHLAKAERANKFAAEKQQRDQAQGHSHAAHQSPSQPVHKVSDFLKADESKKV